MSLTNAHRSLPPRRVCPTAKPTNTTPITAVLSMDPTERATTAEAVPLQFHLHSHSEHTVDGGLWASCVVWVSC